MPLPHQAVRVGFLDHRPLLAMAMECLADRHPEHLKLAWVATSLASLAGERRTPVADVFIVGGPELNLVQTVTDLAPIAPVLVLLDQASDHLHDRAVLAGAMGAALVTDNPALLVRAVVKLSQGEFWLERKASSRLMGGLARGNQRAPVLADQLTHREKSILRMVVAKSGLGARQIAPTLGISESTLRNHLTSIYGKLGVSSRIELVEFAYRTGLSSALEPA